MAVNGIELAVGQKWKTRGGQEVEIVNNDGHRVYPWDLSNGDSTTEQGDVLCNCEDEFDLITLIQDEHGFTPWSGGDCPVEYGVKIEYKMKNDPTKVFEGFPDGLRWGHFDLGGDIIAYRVVEQKAEPTKVDTDGEQVKEVTVGSKEEHTEEPKYTIKEVFDAINTETDYTAPFSSIERVQKYLAKTNDPDYNLYLQLKAKFE